MKEQSPLRYRPKMTFDQLHAFVVVAEKLHVTQASDILGRSQSAVSSTLSNLESRFGIKLFSRVGRRIELTAAGSIFLQEAQSILNKAAGMEKALESLSELKTGRLTISASQTIGNYYIPTVLSEFKNMYPGITVELSISNTKNVAQDVESGSADLGFVEGPVSSSLLEDYLFKGDALKIVVSQRYYRENAEAIASGDLRKIHWVMREGGSGTRAEFEKFLAVNGLATSELQVVFELPTNEAVRMAVEVGSGATAISGLVVESGIRSGELVELPYRVAQRYFHLLWHRERYKSASATCFVDLVTSGYESGSAQLASNAGSRK